MRQICYFKKQGEVFIFFEELLELKKNAGIKSSIERLSEKPF